MCWLLPVQSNVADAERRERGRGATQARLGAGSRAAPGLLRAAPAHPATSLPEQAARPLAAQQGGYRLLLYSAAPLARGSSVNLSGQGAKVSQLVPGGKCTACGS